MQKRYYIAYGSNLNIRQMRMRCPHARVIGTSVIKDYELLFKGNGIKEFTISSTFSGLIETLAAFEKETVMRTLRSRNMEISN